MRLNKIPKNSKGGFSMIEMLVSMAIIILISTMFLANYRSGIKRSDLSMATNILAADTRLAQSYSLGLVKYDTVFPDGGWGVHFNLNENDRYYFFADGYLDPADYLFQSNEALPQYKGKTTIFNSDIRLKDIEVKVNGVTYHPEKITITFTPPDPKTIIYNITNEQICEEATVTLENIKDGSTMKMLVNFVGLVDTVQ